jgi:hypothetical protein
VLAAGCQFQPVRVSVQTDGRGADTPALDGHVSDGHVEPDAHVPDATNPTSPTVLTSSTGHISGDNQLTYSIQVPEGSDELLLVTAQVGQDICATAPTVQNLTFNGSLISRVTTVVGVPGCSIGTDTELWSLLAPATGSGSIVITLDASPTTLDSGAVVVSGVDPASPISVTTTADGVGMSGSASITSAPGDLVVSFVGQGNGIADAGPGSDGASTLYLLNINADSSLNNIAASAIAGATTTTAIWDFTTSEDWQEILVSLRP